MKGCSGVCSCESNRESKLAALVEEGKVEEREREKERETVECRRFASSKGC